MPSPFPGMDPYLEGDLWTTLHVQLAVEIARQLTPRLLPRYLAFPNQRQVTDALEDVAIAAAEFYPDVGVVKAGKRALKGSGAVLADAPFTRTTVMPTSVPHSWVEIRDKAQRKLVTMIEILSPTNKRGQGRKEYLKKRAKILRSSAHLLEIDLLRKGKRLPMAEPLPEGAYFVFLTRANKRPQTDTWPIALDEPLPTVRVPLLEPDPDVPLDLQQAFAAIYDLSRYDLAIDYSKPPDVPIPKEAAGWAKKRIKAAHIQP
jgi:hypothetical protein